MKIFLSVFVCCTLLILACQGTAEKKMPVDKYEAGKKSLAEIEQENPAQFLQAKANDRKNLLRQTVVKGEVTNTARIVTYKDVDVKLYFYSKTGVLLEEDHEMIYDKIAPGASKSFKTKLFTPKGTDSVRVEVVSAKY
ncbi:MAG: hypothetical protein IPL97_11955 [Niastella sp.]|nr:hypothetical protein [Niastella sp.]